MESLSQNNFESSNDDNTTDTDSNSSVKQLFEKLKKNCFPLEQSFGTDCLLRTILYDNNENVEESFNKIMRSKKFCLKNDFNQSIKLIFF